MLMEEHSLDSWISLATTWESDMSSWISVEEPSEVSLGLMGVLNQGHGNWLLEMNISISEK